MKYRHTNNSKEDRMEKMQKFNFAHVFLLIGVLTIFSSRQSVLAQSNRSSD